MNNKVNIKLVVFDFDGVFTNGNIYFNNNGKLQYNYLNYFYILYIYFYFFFYFITIFIINPNSYLVLTLEDTYKSSILVIFLIF